MFVGDSMSGVGECHTLSSKRAFSKTRETRIIERSARIKAPGWIRCNGRAGFGAVEGHLGGAGIMS